MNALRLNPGIPCCIKLSGTFSVVFFTIVVPWVVCVSVPPVCCCEIWRDSHEIDRAFIPLSYV